MAKEVSLAAMSRILDQDLSAIEDTAQLEGIAFDRFHEDDGDEFFLSGCRSASGAIEMTRNREGRIRAIFLHAIESPEKRVNLAEIPFDTSRDDLRDRMGEPELASEGGEHAILGRFPPSDRFRIPEHRCRLGVQYSEELDAVTLITLFPEDWAPGD